MTGKDAAPVFSGKQDDGRPADGGHRHAHYLCESIGGDRWISHINVYAPNGFDEKDEDAFFGLTRAGVWGSDGYDLQLVLLGVGQPADFGVTPGSSEKAGRSLSLATATTWTSRTPFILNRHLPRRSWPSPEAVAADPELRPAFTEAVRFELRNRLEFANFAESVEINPFFNPKEAGTYLGGHFTAWSKFRRDRRDGSGAKAASTGLGFRLTFPQAVAGPIALGYASHFGLGQFTAEF